MTKVFFAGLDVSLELTSISVVDADGAMIPAANAVSDPADISELLARTDGNFERVGFEAGPSSQCRKMAYEAQAGPETVPASIGGDQPSLRTQSSGRG